MRVNTSPPPPAGNGTMNLICREDCADAFDAESRAANTVATLRTLQSLLMRYSPGHAPLRALLPEDSLIASDGHGQDDGRDRADDRGHACDRGDANAPVRVVVEGPR